MKNRILIITLLLLNSIISSCSSDDELNYQNEYEISKNAWLDFKESSNNSYKYTVINSSWVGISSETIITVENGIIKQRSFEYTFTEGLPDDYPESELQWNEVENEIGIHENGAEPITLDEIYTKARQDWLIERGNATTYFKTENGGMISLCGYIENQCADDCFRGIKISSIQDL